MSSSLTKARQWKCFLISIRLINQDLDQTPRILFHTEIPDFQFTEEEATLSWLIAVVAAESKAIEAVNYIFLSDDELLQVNQEYLNHDYYTDVISFQLASEPIEGDIFISVDRVRENAASLDLPFIQELRRIMVHGLLHFIGYGDKTPEEKAIMTQKEDEYLAKYTESL